MFSIALRRRAAEAHDENKSKLRSSRERFHGSGLRLTATDFKHKIKPAVSDRRFYVFLLGSGVNQRGIGCP
jgi:hypothetical protein